MAVKATSSVTLMMVSDGAKGSDGKGISTIIHHYLVTNVTTGVTTNTTGWKTSPSSVTTTNKYLWYYQTINYTTGNPTNTTPAIIGVYGDTGGKGETGKGIKSVTPEYYLSTSNTTQTGGSWKTTQDAWVSGRYYWTRDSINWNDGSTTTTTPTLATGLNNANSTANNAQTIANQTASKFQWIVKSGNSATNFTLTDRTAQLVADSINLKGLVTFKGLDSSTQKKINDANNKIDNLQVGGRNLLPITDFNGISKKHIVPDGTVLGKGGEGGFIFEPTLQIKSEIEYTISLNLRGNANINFYQIGANDDNYATPFVNKTELSESEYKRFTLTFIVKKERSLTEVYICTRWGSSAAGDWFEIEPRSLKLELGNKATDWTPAPEDKANQSIIDNWSKDDVVGDETTINGGYIKTGTIDSNRSNVEDIFSSGSAVMNIINAQEINADRITSGKISSKYIDAYGLSILDKDSNIETFSISSDGQVMLRGSVESYDYVSGKSGWSINRNGSAEFNDVTVRGSVITGDGGIASSGGLGTNLQKNSSFYDGLNDWTYSRGMWQVDSSFKYNGTNTISFVRQGLVSENATNLRSLNNAIPATSGETFTAQANFYTTDFGSQFNQENVKLRVIFFNSSGTSLSESFKTIPFVNKSWVNVEVTGTAPANTSYVVLCITNTLNGVYWMAQPKIERGSTATAWSLSPNDKGQTPRFWAGTTYENREYAPFIVYNDGSLKATRGTFGGVFTGDIQIGNVSIVDPSSSSGNDATITVLNGSSGIRAIQLTDTTQSSFAQNLIISDNYYNEQIRLSQNGSINASNQIVIGNINDTTSDRAILTDTYLQFGGGTISSSDKKITINRADDLEVGSITNATDLTIYGNANIKNVLKVFKEINFNDVVKCTISRNGLDFNFYDGSNDTTYRVRWDTQGGSTIADSYVVQNKTVTKPTNPTYSDGATFLGWYKDKTYTQEWSFDYPVNNNMTLYAKWAEPTQPKLSEANCLKTNTCIAYRTLDGVDTVGNGWKIIFDYTSFSGKVVGYDWYADLYEIADNGGYKISKADVINGQTKNTVSGVDLVKITGYEKNYELKGRCSVVVKLGNTTKTYTYDGFRSICELK